MGARLCSLLVGSASLALAIACSSFGTGDGMPSAVVDAGLDTSRPVEGTPVCTAPAAPVLAPPSCDTACPEDLVFATQPVDDAVVSGTTIYVLRSGVLLTSTNIDSGVLTKASTVALRGTPRKMALDEQYVYVSTELEHVRYAIGDQSKEALPLLDGDLSPVFFGRSVFFQMQAAHVVRTPKSGRAPVSVEVLGTDALALDGDNAYWIGVNAGGDHVIHGPFPKTDEHGVVKMPVLGFAVKDGFAYVAEKSDPLTGSSSIARISLTQSGRASLVEEPGVIEAVEVHDGRLYWIAARPTTDGARVLVSTDLCGAAGRALAKRLDPLSTLSFEPASIYAARATTGPIYRVKR